MFRLDSQLKLPQKRISKGIEFPNISQLGTGGPVSKFLTLGIEADFSHHPPGLTLPPSPWAESQEVSFVQGLPATQYDVNRKKVKPKEISQFLKQV